MRDRRRAEVEIKREPHNYPGSVYLSATLSIPVVKPDADVTPLLSSLVGLIRKIPGTRPDLLARISSNGSK